jgi:hypothetical protein
VQRLLELPNAFKRYRDAHGVLEFAAFQDADGGLESSVAAIRELVPDADGKRLLELGPRSIDDATFFGDWYDTASQAIARPATGYTIGRPGDGGDFARAFLSPPYGLWVAGSQPGTAAAPSNVDAMFNEVREFILPLDLDHQVLDWAHPNLTDVSDYFAVGMEWWGVFLFTIHVPALGRLTAVAGSTTD